jgi:hypothetical protein
MEMNTKVLLKYFFKKVLLFCSPFLVIILVYIISDPFKILYKYDNYYSYENYFIYKNRDFVSTEMYLKNHRKYKYDSFIFGSSTCLFFQPSVWRKYISTSNNIFSFDASGENMVGIWSKIKFVHKNDDSIKNTLLVFDTDNTFAKFRNEGHIFMKHYKVYPSSKYKFHYKSLLSFLNLKFLVGFVHYKLSHHFYSYMNNLFDDRYYYFDLVTNELYFEGPLNELKTDSLKYYKKRINIFYHRINEPVEIHSQITESHIQMLREIKEIFNEDSTNYRIVITPMYDQISFNRDDLKVLQNIFGEKNIFDFSGINNYTVKESNYYDPYHFKQYVGVDILRLIY